MLGRGPGRMTPFSNHRGPAGGLIGPLTDPWRTLRQLGSPGYRGPGATRLPHTPEPITHRPASRWDHREGTQSQSGSREALAFEG